MKRFTHCLMNPPYGKNANLAIAFLNKAAKHTDNIVCIMPRTIRKPVALNRVNEHLHLVEDKTNADDAFGGELYTCSQTWKVKDTKRSKVERFTKDMVEDFFEFVTREEGDIAIGRVGRGGTGEVFLRDKDMGHRKNYDERSSGTTYFIKVHDKAVIQELIDLYPKFQEASRDVIGPNSLSIDEIVRTLFGDLL